MGKVSWIIISLILILTISSFWFGRNREIPPWMKCKESLFAQVVLKQCTPSELTRPSINNSNNSKEQILPLEEPKSDN